MAKELKTLTVFCAAKEGKNPHYKAAIVALGKIIAENKIRLAYGGASIGLMGLLAQTVREHGGTVIGVMPKFIQDFERPFECDELIWVETMEERKHELIRLGDAILTMSGAGDGTIDELADVFTLIKHNLIGVPNVIHNVDDFWTSLIDQRRRMVAEGFIKKEIFEKTLVVENVEDILPAIWRALCNGNGSNVVDLNPGRATK